MTDILQAAAVDDQYVLAEDRRRDLCQALGLPLFAVGFGYRYIDQGEAPFGLEVAALVKAGS